MSVECREYRLSKGRVVTTYDNALSLKARQGLYAFAVNASFQIGWSDTDAIENRQHAYLHARFTPEELARSGLLLELAPTPVFAQVAGWSVSKAVLNLSTPSDVYFPHTHKESRVLLYYVNPDWRPQWHGETLFFDDGLREIELATPYVPGRVTVFPGDIAHSIRPQSSHAPGYRFTLAVFFEPPAPA